MSLVELRQPLIERLRLLIAKPAHAELEVLLGAILVVAVEQNWLGQVKAARGQRNWHVSRNAQIRYLKSCSRLDGSRGLVGVNWSELIRIVATATSTIHWTLERLNACHLSRYWSCVHPVELINLHPAKSACHSFARRAHVELAASQWLAVVV